MAIQENFHKKYAPPSAFDDYGNYVNIKKDLQDWLNTNINDAMHYLRLNRGWRDADLCMSILYGDDNVRVSKKSGLSRLSIKKLRRQAKEQIANHTTVQPKWGFRTYKTEDEVAEKQATIYTKLLNAWFYRQFIDKKIESVLNWTEGAGTGWLLLWPDKDLLTGEIDIIAHALSHKQVMVFHCPADAEYQKAYGVCVRLEMPIPEAHEKFPLHIDLINEDRSVPSWIARPFKAVKRLWRGVYDRMEYNKATRISSNPYPTVDIFLTWVRDDSVNLTGRDIVMGEVGSHYAYTVPSFYDENNEINRIETGEIDNEGNPVLREVSREDCKLYPKRRMFISCSGGIIYDGPPMWGDKLVPVVPFKFESVVGELLGLSPINDGRQIEENVNMLIRTMINSALVKAAPPIGIDDSIPIDIAKNFNPSRPNQKLRYNTRILQNGIKVLMDSEFFRQDAAIPGLIELLLQMQDHVVGTSDWQTAAMKLKQMPGADTQESMMQALGVLTTAQSRGVEKSLLMLGMIWIGFAPQVFTVDKIMDVLGPEGTTFEMFDYHPNSLVEYKDPMDSRDYYVRFCEHIKKFGFYAAPSSLQEKQSIQNRLAVLQAKNAGAKISGRKIYDALIPDGEYNKSKAEFIAEQKEDIEMAAELNAQIQKARQDLENPVVGAINSVLGRETKQGRPPTNKAPARLEQKTDDNGVPRSTLATS